MESTEPLVPLPEALDAIAREITPAGESVPIVRNEQFDGLASTVSVLVAVYTCSPGGPERRLSNDELDAGRFRRGGCEIYFADGRPPITDLAITRGAVSEVAELLRGIALRE